MGLLLESLGDKALAMDAYRSAIYHYRERERKDAQFLKYHPLLNAIYSI